jgi:cell division septal protein FtsQ
VKGFGGGCRRGSGARPRKPAGTTVPTRSADAALGRSVRGMVGPARRGPAQPMRPSAGRLRAGRRLVNPARAAALLGMLAFGFALTFVTGPTAFGLSRTDVPALTWTSPEALQAALAQPRGVNLFRLETAPIVAALEGLPAVVHAEVSVSLPDATLVVRVDEREPVLAWTLDETRYIVDREGRIFATLAKAAAVPAGVAAVDDRRPQADGLVVGASLDAVDLDVATRLGSLTPADIGSNATRLTLAVTESDGFILVAPGGWTAVFGFYSPATRPTDMIPAQVRLLKSLLAGREGSLARIILASGTDGTYIPKPTPKPSR